MKIRYISLSLCPKINSIDIDQSLINIYENKYNLDLETVERTLSASIINSSEPNNYFENDIPIAIFILDGVILCNGGKTVEIEKSQYRGNKYKFSISTKPLLI